MIEFDLEKNYITSQSALNYVVALIKDAKFVALDTEFTRRTTYYPILSIIQIAVRDSAGKKNFFMIDAVSKLDLEEFFKIIADKKIVKILHSSMQDLQIFYKESNLLPENVIDTQIMANFCNFGFGVGYSSLVNEIFNKKLDKTSQASDWQLRPLTKKQIDYALMDVFFLEEIYQKLLKILEEKNRKKWFFEEMNNFVEKSLLKPDESLTKNFIFRQKSPRQIAQINELTLLRESWARRMDKPRQHIIKDETIDNLVMGRNIEIKINKVFLDEINNILNKNFDNFDDISLLKMGKPLLNSKQKDSFLEAKKLMSKISVQEKFQEQFLITSNDLRQIICAKELFEKTVFGWRYEVFGKELEKIIY